MRTAPGRITWLGVIDPVARATCDFSCAGLRYRPRASVARNSPLEPLQLGIGGTCADTRGVPGSSGRSSQMLRPRSSEAPAEGPRQDAPGTAADVIDRGRRDSSTTLTRWHE